MDTKYVNNKGCPYVIGTPFFALTEETQPVR
ncbi:unnamed protein product, partial [Rotaria magnacalcarata]